MHPAPRPQFGPPCRGFTLIELLVVVAIIALLIAILLPSLSKAKQISMRTTCAANIRGVAYNLNMYAQDNSDIQLLGFDDNAKQYNNRIRRSGIYFLFGFATPVPESCGPEKQIASANAVSPSSLKIYYCPAQTNLDYSLNTNNNPIINSTTQFNTIRAGYGSRPCLNPENSNPDKGNWPWRGAQSNRMPPGNPGSLFENMGGIYTQYSRIIGLPRTNDLPNKAIISDLASMPMDLEQGHKDGINVAWSDSSVSWVSRGKFNAPLAQIPDGNLSSTNDTFVDQIWVALDRNR